MRTPKSILVTGGAGFIGSAFIRLLFRDKSFTGRVTNLDALTYAGNLENLAGHVDESRYTFVKADLRDMKAVEAAVEAHAIDCIVHFAAESHVDRSIHGPRDFIETNVLGTFNLLEAVRARPAIHFHHVSTDEVYGSLGDTGLFTESTPYDPRSPYSSSKAASDHLVSAYHHTYGLSTTLSNCSNNYGPHHFPEKLIPLMILNCFEGKPLPIYGDGGNVRDWLYVDDHAEAVWLVVRRGRSGQSYNVGGKCEKKNVEVVHALIDTVARLTQRPRADFEKLITYVKDRPGHDRRYAIDCSKIERELGWAPRHDFTRGLADTVRWYLDNPKWIANVKSGAYRTWLDQNYAGR
ncbi:MAG: dTDP-glucose 4,6-dehydratase [Deltaproteobacteria bacterium]|nr:dTDP-glucose 4,6-dehydratase [Deltaproteobacteria bacterium]